MEDEDVAYESILGDSIEDIAGFRDDAMDFTELFYEEPEQADLVSVRMDEMLAEGSDYLTEAGDLSEQERLDRGFLDSEFNRGVGEAAAIDSAFDVAYGDAYVDVLNTQAVNDETMLEYDNSVEIAYDNFISKVELTAIEHSYSLNQATLDSMYSDYQEQMDNAYTYDYAMIENQADIDTDRLYMLIANAEIDMSLAAVSSLQTNYLADWTNIIYSPIRQEDKATQLEALEQNLVTALNSISTNVDTLQVGDNPYDIEGFPYYEVIGGDYTGAAFVWELNDADHAWTVARAGIITEIDKAIHDVTNHAERNEYSDYGTLETIRDSMGGVLKYQPELGTDIMEWWTNVGRFRVEDDGWEDVFRTWEQLIYSANGRYSYIYSNNYDDYPSSSSLTYTEWFWNSETQSIDEEVTYLRGYWEALYREYDQAISNESIYVPPIPDGYLEAKAACKWPMEWRNGGCYEEQG